MRFLPQKTGAKALFWRGGGVCAAPGVWQPVAISGPISAQNPPRQVPLRADRGQTCLDSARHICRPHRPVPGITTRYDASGAGVYRILRCAGAPNTSAPGRRRGQMHQDRNIERTACGIAEMRDTKPKRVNFGLAADYSRPAGAHFLLTRAPSRTCLKGQIWAFELKSLYFRPIL